MPAIAVAETTDITPWGGFEVTHDESICLGPLLTPLGRTTIDSGVGDKSPGENGASVMSITTGGRLRLQTDIRGRFRHLDLGERHLRLELPAGPAGWIEIPGGKILARPARRQGAERRRVPARDPGAQEAADPRALPRGRMILGLRLPQCRSGGAGEIPAAPRRDRAGAEL